MSGILDFLKGLLSIFVKNFPDFVQKLFNKIPQGIKEKVSVIIDVVNGIKGHVDSPLADVLTTVIPGTVDDKIKDWLRKMLPIVLKELNLLNDGIISLSEDKAIKGGQLRAVASVLTEKLTDMPGDQAAITSAVVYQNSK